MKDEQVEIEEELGDFDNQRIDFLDNAIYKFLASLNRTTEKATWETGIIEDIRDLIHDYYVEVLGICTSKQFYSS